MGISALSSAATSTALVGCNIGDSVRVTEIGCKGIVGMGMSLPEKSNPDNRSIVVDIFADGFISTFATAGCCEAAGGGSATGGCCGC